MKILHISDNHLGAIKYRKNETYNDFLKVFEEIFQLAFEYNPDIIIHSGDLFDRDRPESIALKFAFEKFSELSKKFKILVTPGNHDFKARIGLSPISVFENENVKVVEMNRIFKDGKINVEELKFSYNGINFYLLPYFSNRQILKDTISEILQDLETSEINFLVLHQIIDEETSRQKSGIIDIPFERLKDFDFIFLGHFHTPKIREKFAYVGSSEALKYDEYEYDENGFIKQKTRKRIILYEVLDKNNIRKEEIFLKTPREYIKIEFDDPTIGEIENKLKNYEDNQKILILKINNASYDIIPELNSLLNNLKFYHIEKIITSFKQFQSQNFKITNDNYKQEILGNYYEIVMEIIENINLNDVEKKKEDIEKDIENALMRLENENKINRA
jgi:exonuclease SbcD